MPPTLAARWKTTSAPSTRLARRLRVAEIVLGGANDPHIGAQRLEVPLHRTADEAGPSGEDHRSTGPISSAGLTHGPSSLADPAWRSCRARSGSAYPNQMTGLFLSAWVLFPLLLLGVCTGAGLLVRRLSGNAVSGVLVLPVGFALLVALSTLGTSIRWLAPATGALVVAVAVVGILLEF